MEVIDVWVLWVFLAVVLGIAELFTLTVVLGLLGGAALITAGVAATGLPMPLQLLAFAVVAPVGLKLIRPATRRHTQQLQRYLFGVDALAGRTAVVLKEVCANGGIVQIGVEQWTARSIDENLVIPAGESVTVLRIDGVAAIVYPSE